MTREEEIRGLQRRFMFGGDLDRDAVQSLFDYIDYLLKENQKLRYGIIRLHEFTKFVPGTDGEDEDPDHEEQALAFLNKLFDIQKMARELRQSLGVENA